MKRRFMLSGLALLVAIVTLMSAGCGVSNPKIDGLEINGKDAYTMTVGSSLALSTTAPDNVTRLLKWSSSDTDVVEADRGTLYALATGRAVVTVSYGEYRDRVMITVVAPDGSPDTEKPDDNGGNSGDNGNTDGGNTDGGNNDGGNNDGGNNDGGNTDGGNNDGGNTDGGNTDDSGNGGNTDSDGKPTGDIETLTQGAAWIAYYGGYTPALTVAEAAARSALGELSGLTTVPDQEPNISDYRPEKNGLYIHNNESYYLNDDTYIVVNAYGEAVFCVIRGGGYITLDEVAAYVYAFGEIPANYTSKKSGKPSSNIWGEHLRLNHSYFSGDTSSYPYEPVLPNISGCGGDLQYYEMDIGTTGTDCDPSYTAKIYNDGSKITRGAARIVYGRDDLDGDGVFEEGEIYLFYTYNHYNDFQEYLNYYGGWGEMFGNITGGGEISSKTNYNPTPYVMTVRCGLDEAATVSVVAIINTRKYDNFFLAA